MIISRTPFRISFFGGSTDIKEFYEKEPGCVISTTIDKHFYTMLNTRLDHKIRLAYSKMEEVDNIQCIDHDYARGCLELLPVNGVEIVISSDIPAKGSGLGSSSSTTIGLLQVLLEYIKRNYNKEDLAKLAYHVEHDILNFSCGKQDQYAASYGGFNYIQFDSEKTVVQPIKTYEFKKQIIADNLLLFYTGIPRISSEVSKKIIKNIPSNFSVLKELKEQTLYMKDKLESNFDIEEFGKELSREWELKKRIAKLSTPEIDRIYEIGLKAGAYGGKLCGSGLGGFFVFCCETDYQEKLRKKLKNFKSLKVKFDKHGSIIIHKSE